MPERAFLKPNWSTANVRLSDATMQDVELMAALHQSRSEVEKVDPSFVPVSMPEYEGYVRASIAGELERFPFRLQIMRIADEPCGYFHAYGDHPIEGRLFISMFVIVPKFAGKGIGAEVAQGIICQARDLQFKRILLSVFLDNRSAIAFWVKQGFLQIEKYRPSRETGKPDRFILAQDL